MTQDIIRLKDFETLCIEYALDEVFTDYDTTKTKDFMKFLKSCDNEDAFHDYIESINFELCDTCCGMSISDIKDKIDTHIFTYKEFVKSLVENCIVLANVV